MRFLKNLVLSLHNNRWLIESIPFSASLTAFLSLKKKKKINLGWEVKKMVEIDHIQSYLECVSTIHLHEKQIRWNGVIEINLLKAGTSTLAKPFSGFATSDPLTQMTQLALILRQLLSRQLNFVSFTQDKWLDYYFLTLLLFLIWLGNLFQKYIFLTKSDLTVNLQFEKKYLKNAYHNSKFNYFESFN